jgi:diguanylate cyclase (GGDEF)-like protein
MDYGTFFSTNIASVTVFTVCIGVLAWYNRRLIGMRWFAAAQLVGLAKLILQGLEGKIPAVFGSFTVSELYLVSITMQWMGLRWFVVRKPMHSRWPWIALGGVLAAYTLTFALKVRYSANIANIPFVAVCGASSWMLWKHGKAPFIAVSRIAAAVSALQMGVAAYRAVLTNLRYMHPIETVRAHADPQWVESLAAAAFLATVMVMCEFGFLVMELQRELAEQARTDPLTGALNRRSMEEAARRETARCMRSGCALSMIVVDIDNFKQLNDTRGHAAGDRALQAIVCRIKSVLRRQDLLARTGGEEFAILLPDTDESGALTIAERVRRGVERLEVVFERGTIRMTVCAGAAQLDRACGWEHMFQQADQAMYEAKRHGRNLISARLEPDSISIELRGGADRKDWRYVQAHCGTI